MFSLFYTYYIIYFFKHTKNIYNSHLYIVVENSKFWSDKSDAFYYKAIRK